MRFDPSDRPLIVQFGGAGVEELLPASLIAQEYDIDAIDINMGCPQQCARQGGYGAFLLENPDEAYRIVRTLSQSLKKPVTVKIRIFDDIEKSVEFAKNIEACGASMITVHGRTKEQKGSKAGPCNWEAIRRIKAALKIPVVSNGGLQQFGDIERCLALTKADAVMSADAMLWNPTFFANLIGDPCDMIIEYINIYRHHQERTRKVVNSHVFEILRSTFDLCPEYRRRYNLHQDLDRMIEIFRELKVAAQVKRTESAEKPANDVVAVTVMSVSTPAAPSPATGELAVNAGVSLSLSQLPPSNMDLTPMDVANAQGQKRDLTEMSGKPTEQDHQTKKAKLDASH